MSSSCFPHVETRCHKQVALDFNQMEEAHLTQRAARGEFTQQELFHLGVNVFKLKMLDELAKRKAREIGKGHEELEVVLYYRTKLAAKLKLPHQPGNMLFEKGITTGENENVVLNRADLEKAALAVQSAARNRQKITQFLAGWKPWQQDLARRHPKNFNTASLEQAKIKLHEHLEKLRERRDLGEGVRMQRIKAVTEIFDKLDDTVFRVERKRLTRKVVRSNVPSWVQSRIKNVSGFLGVRLPQKILGGRKSIR